MQSGALATSHTKWQHKLDVPTLDMPCAEWPQLKYPLSEHAQENAETERRSLQQVLTYWFAFSGHRVEEAGALAVMALSLKDLEVGALLLPLRAHRANWD